MRATSKDRIMVWGIIALALFTTGTLYGINSLASAGSDHLKTFSSYYELLSFLQKNTAQARLYYASPFFDMITSFPVFSKEFSAMTQGSGDRGSEYSTTNIQVEGVDEADLVKMDGEYIYIVSHSTVYIAKAFPPGDAKILATIEAGNVDNVGLYISGNKLVILGDQYRWYLDYYSGGDWSMEKVGGSGFVPCYPNTVIAKVYDVSDKSAPVLVRDLSINGTVSGSRMMGDYVYVVVQQPAMGYIEDMVVLPVIMDNNSTKTVQPNEVSYSDVPSLYYNFVTILAVNTANDSAPPTYETILTSISSVMHVSQNNMYLTVPKYPVHIMTMGSLVGDKGGESSEERQKTLIYRISLNGEDISVEADGSVYGLVHDQFSMDEYNGNFRMATTEWTRDGTINNLYVLNPKLEVMGSLEGLAPGESIYSARFMGDRCYLVTFRQIDPFYVIDVSNPTAPKVLGYLKIPGFSSYLHPYDGEHIIGVGMEGSGVKLSLFDATNVSAPVEVAKFNFNATWSYTEVNNDHRAFLFDKAKALLVLPVSLSMPAGDRWVYWQGAAVFSTTLENGFQLKGTVTHQDGASGGGDISIRRSLYIGNVLYTVSGAKVKMNDLWSLLPMGELLLSAGNGGTMK
ncbi:MAG: hypothetical protein FJZ49_06975 [Candidatus Verstraetearchaeota archaeon]|nr:hypothetical protein [Candidatus Verstraetearchaeota archaeon]